MAYTIPNRPDTAYAPLARFYSIDAEILAYGSQLTGVKSGCAVTAQGSPNMTVAVASGEIYYQFVTATVTAGNVTITTAHASLDRLDLVVVNSSGTKSVVAGTAAAVPLPPAIPASSVALALVMVPATDTTISSGQISDKRHMVQVPAVTGASTLVIKPTDEPVSASTTLQDDDHLRITATTNTAYFVRFVLKITQPTSNNSMKVNFSFPAAASWLAVTSVPSSYTAAGTDLTFTISQTPIVHTIEGILVTAGTGGDLRLRWAQVVSSANIMLMMAKSFVEYRVLT